MVRFLAIAACLIAASGVAQAGVSSKAVQETAEFVFRTGGREAAELGMETLTRKIENLAAKYGDDALVAVKKVKTKTFRIVEEAGENGLKSVRLLAHYGDDAVWVVAKKNRMAIFIKYGDDAAEAMMKHGEIAEPLINALGKPATGALKAVSTQNGRRLAMMADDGALKAIGKTDELLAVVGKYGDGAMDFIWRNKGALAVGATLTAFLVNPQPFIDGTVDLSKSGIEGVAKPVATGIAINTNWTVILLAVTAVASFFIGLRLWLRHRPMPCLRPTANDRVQ